MLGNVYNDEHKMIQFEFTNVDGTKKTISVTQAISFIILDVVKLIESSYHDLENTPKMVVIGVTTNYPFFSLDPLLLERSTGFNASPLPGFHPYSRRQIYIRHRSALARLRFLPVAGREFRPSKSFCDVRRCGLRAHDGLHYSVQKQPYQSALFLLFALCQLALDRPAPRKAGRGEGGSVRHHAQGDRGE